MDENEKVMKNQEETAQVQETNNATVIKTDADAKDGQNKCPKCGATDISLNPKNGKLRCNFCRHEFEPEKLDAMEKDISKLEGEIVGSGATNIIADTNDMVTFKCSSCGAEVVVDTAKATQARCHWCRNTLSVNQQIPNGAVPDTVLPFSIPKKEAKEEKSEVADLSKLTVAELKAECQKNGIEVKSTMKKADLVEALSK